jgi:tRNA(fMet)-specific endonuclease VapC
LIHLDENVAIALLNESSKAVREKFEAARAAATRLCLSTIVYHELMYGAAYSERRTANEDKIAVFIVAGRLTLLPFGEADAREAADTHLRRLATPIGPHDVLIATQARRASAPLVTANSREFERVPGLLVTDWAA